MLSIKNLDLSISRVPILRSVNLEIETGTTCGLIGRNGAGKTTLMRAIMGVLPAQGGSIQFNHKDLHTEKAHMRTPLGIGYLPEDRRLVPHFTVEENILVPLWATKTTDHSRLKYVYELMPEIGRFADRKAMSLSGGQQKLVALGRALVSGSNLLLLDEPFEGVAPALAKRLMEVIGELTSEHLTVLIAESDFTHSAGVVDDVFVIERGHVEKKTDFAS